MPSTVLIVLFILVLIEPLRRVSVVWHLHWYSSDEDSRVPPPKHAAKLPKEAELRELWSNSKSPNYSVFLLSGACV